VKVNPQYLKRWSRDEPYVGTDFSAYFVAATRVPAAGDAMTESNYEVIKARLSAEGLPFREEWFKHWVVGRLDVLLVHEVDDALRAQWCRGINGVAHEVDREKLAAALEAA